MDPIIFLHRDRYLPVFAFKPGVVRYDIEKALESRYRNHQKRVKLIARVKSMVSFEWLLHHRVTTQPRNMSLRGAAWLSSLSRHLVLPKQSPNAGRLLRRDSEKTSGQASKSPPRNDMPEQLRNSRKRAFKKSFLRDVRELRVQK